MLKEDAFIRYLPYAVNSEERFIIDGSVMASDMAELALKRLVSELTAVSVLDAAKNLDRTQVLEIALNSWSIVDSVHNFRELLKVITKNSAYDFAEFNSRSNIYTILRNKMDHQASNIRNMANQKGPVHPMYGSISFLGPISDDNVFFVHQLSLGNLQGKANVFPIIDTHARPKNDEISKVSLAAFGEQIEFEPIVADIGRVLSHLNDTLEPIIRKNIETHASEKQLEAQKILDEKAVGTIRLSMRVQLVTGEGLIGSSQEDKKS